jgi:arginine/lysine/ornithine decarboxylase
MNEIINAPLYRALVHHMEKKSISFHVPGHKNGEVFTMGAESVYENLLKIDVTELNGLDDLHDPQEVIKEAQNLLTKYYKTEKSYFLVNGTTVGNIVMLFSTVNAGEVVLIQRNCHKSILNALAIIGATPVFLSPEVDNTTVTATGLSYKQVKEAVKTYPKAKALVLTNPSYYGYAQDLTSIVEVVHSNDILVLVDEAHGAHFSLGDPFPKSAIYSKADIIVQSAHKTLPAMTMGSYLHINNKELIQKIEYYLQVFQSSSPSYPIMASLDLARDYIQSLTNEKKLTIILSHQAFKRKLQAIEGIKLVTKAVNGNYKIDPLKVIIQSTNKISGYAIQKCFEAYGIYTELADPKNVLLILPLAQINNQEDIIRKIKTALKGVKASNREVSFNTDYKEIHSITELAISYREMEKRSVTERLLEKCIGHIAAEAIVPYPPGIPVIMPGEIIIEEKINEIIFWKNEGARFQGKSNLNTIKVFAD